MVAPRLSAKDLARHGGERAGREFSQGTRPRVEEALADGAPQREQRRRLALGFNALGNRVEAQRLPEHDDRTCELGALAIGQPADEGAIDLQDVDREPVQVRQ